MKNLYSVCIGLSIVLGVIMSSDIENANANVGLETDPGVEGSIPCWSAGTAPWISFRRYVECGSCTSVKGRATGGKGNCKA